MLDTQHRLYDLGIFNQVDTAVQNPDGTSRSKNVLVDVQEAKRYTFDYGWASNSRPASRESDRRAAGETGVSPALFVRCYAAEFPGPQPDHHLQHQRRQPAAARV